MKGGFFFFIICLLALNKRQMDFKVLLKIPFILIFEREREGNCLASLTDTEKNLPSAMERVQEGKQAAQRGLRVRWKEVKDLQLRFPVVAVSHHYSAWDVGGRSWSFSDAFFPKWIAGKGDARGVMCPQPVLRICPYVSVYLWLFWLLQRRQVTLS